VIEVPDPGRHVLMLINSVDDSSGGNLRAMVNLAEAMVADGVRVTVSAPIVSGREHRTVDLTDPRVSRQLFRASRPAARFGGSIRQLWWLWRSLGQYDEVQTHSIFSLSAVYAIACCAIRRIPIMLWPHGSLDPLDLRKHAWFKRRVGPVVTRRLLDACAALLFTTPREARIAETYGSRTRREVVPLPVSPLEADGADPADWRERHGVPSDAPVVLFLGRINYKKRLPLLVEAVSLSSTDAWLVVVGDGETAERAEVDEVARACGMTHRMRMLGWQEGRDRVEAFLAADVFALLSDFENFGLAVVEALSVGCPVVISTAIDLADQLGKAGAASCVEQDPVRAAAAIDELLLDRSKATAMGARGRALVERDFAPAAVASRLCEISASVRSSSGRGADR
jgi:glycosyltransferase involved in cell wall biosynthesis